MFTNHLSRRLSHLDSRHTSGDPVIHHHYRVDPNGVVIEVADSTEAVIVFEGRMVASLGPGTHTIHPEEIAYWTDGDDGAFDTWFVSTAPLAPVSVTDTIDTADGSLRVQTTVRYQFTEPALAVESLAASVDLARPEALTYWLGRQTLSAVRSAVTSHPGADASIDPATVIERHLDDLVTPVGLRVLPPVAAATGVQSPTLTCDNCGAGIAAGDRFCAVCGEPVSAVTCTGCGEPLRPGARFCSSCGVAAPPPHQPGGSSSAGPL